jgi:hypothetical protein
MIEKRDRVKSMYQKIVHFNVKEGKSNEFREWILTHQEEFAKSLPKGWKYLGCYFTVFHMGRREWQIRYEIDGLAAYDTLRAYEDDVFNELLAQIYDFINPNLPIEIEVVKDVKGLRILGERE